MSNQHTFKQMHEWTQELSRIMHDMGIRMHNHIANDPNLAAAINRSVDDIKTYIVSRYALTNELPDNVNWLLQLTLHRIIHTLIEENMQSLTQMGPITDFSQFESEEILTPDPDHESEPEPELPLGVEGVTLTFSVTLTPQTVSAGGKLKAEAFTGVIKAIPQKEDEEHD